MALCLSKLSKTKQKHLREKKHLCPYTQPLSPWPLLISLAMPRTGGGAKYREHARSEVDHQRPPAPPGGGGAGGGGGGGGGGAAAGGGEHSMRGMTIEV